MQAQKCSSTQGATLFIKRILEIGLLNLWIFLSLQFLFAYQLFMWIVFVHYFKLDFYI